MDCDVRDFIPHEQGGFEGLPTHKEIAESMGLTYPSNDVRNTLSCIQCSSVGYCADLFPSLYLMHIYYSPKITTSADQHPTKHPSIVNNPAVMDHQCRALLENIAFRILHVTIELRRVMVLHLHQSYSPVYPLFRMMQERITCFVGRNGKMQIVIASNGVGIEVSVLVVKGECYDAQHKLDF